MAGSITKPKKPKSKRTPVRLRHKIQKASAEKQRKSRKEAKKNPEWRSKLKKDPGIPNLFPFKEKMLQELEDGRRRKQEEMQRRREMAKAAKSTAASKSNDDEDAMEDAEGDKLAEDDDDVMDEDEDEDGEADGDDANPMAALLASARRAAEQYDRDLQSGSDMDDDDDDSGAEQQYQASELPGTTSSRKAYDKIFKQVIDQADVILYVLDARDPEGTRSREVERTVMAAASGGKRLILILNKIDLVPPPVLKDWLVHLRRYFPTLPLRASGSAPNAQTFNHRDLTVQSTSSTLFKSLKSFAASKQLKRAIAVGVIGYPNVGKSSVINALLSRMGGGRSAAACPAGAEAGVTTSIRAVKIDSKLTLLDSPGIVFPSARDANAGSKKDAIEAHAHLVLLNAVPPKQIDDPLPAVNLLIKRLSTSPELLQKLMDTYDLPPLMTTSRADAMTDFLVQVARKRGRLGKGGVPNLPSAAMTVITDWRDGRIQGWVNAPKLAVADASSSSATPAAAAAAGASDDAPMADQKEIVTEWAKEFKLEGLWGDDAAADAAEAMEQ